MESTNAVLVLLVAVLIVGAFLFFVLSFSRKRPRTLDQQKYREAWLMIEQSVGQTDDTRGMAIIKADKLLDKALIERGFMGATMAERMRSAKKVWRDEKKLQLAHKMRNRVAHEHGVIIQPLIAQKILATYKRALTDLGAL